VRELLRCERVAIISDSNVGPLYMDGLQRSLSDARIDVLPITIPAGEQHKHLGTVDAVCDSVLSWGMDRSTPIISLGGGVTGDIAGFVAATILRGVPLVHVPTSLLAMVDAAIGGKTGVNHTRGKNLIGAFHQPRAVYIDPHVLQSLPATELGNGLAECIKHALICDAELFTRMERFVDRALQRDMTYLTELVGRNAAVKARYVQSDPFETGQRAHLNFGHTFGHAFEWASGFAIPHGEAVALGMTAASYTSLRLNMITQEMHDRILALIARSGLPTRGLKAPLDLIFEAMRRDKKIAAGRARFILLDRIGHSVIRDDVPEHFVRDAVERLSQ
jgi:3-dehydroquinate synthase